MGLMNRFKEGLARTREAFQEDMNLLLDRSPDVDDDFWDGLEETLIMSDMGGYSASSIVDKLRGEATRKGYRTAYDVLQALNEEIAGEFVEGGQDILGGDPSIVLFVGVNGSGKTTTTGKIAKEAKDAGRTVILGCADTFRAAAIEQLEVWAQRAGVEICARDRGSDPASVCFETIERGEAIGADLVLIDTAGRLHTSADLMRELEKVVAVVRKRANLPVHLVRHQLKHRRSRRALSVHLHDLPVSRPREAAEDRRSGESRRVGVVERAVTRIAEVRVPRAKELRGGLRVADVRVEDRRPRHTPA